jgi:hypothetical protein
MISLVPFEMPWPIGHPQHGEGGIYARILRTIVTQFHIRRSPFLALLKSATKVHKNAYFAPIIYLNKMF